MRVALLLLVLGLSGCGTITSIEESSERPRRSLVYGGVRQDLRWITTRALLFAEITRTLGALDLPLSLAFDTALLPVTLPHTALTAFVERPDVHAPRPRPAPRPAPPGPTPPGPTPPGPTPPGPTPTPVVGGRRWREPRPRTVDAPREYRAESVLRR